MIKMCSDKLKEINISVVYWNVHFLWLLFTYCPLLQHLNTPFKHLSLYGTPPKKPSLCDQILLTVFLHQLCHVFSANTVMLGWCWLYNCDITNLQEFWKCVHFFVDRAFKTLKSHFLQYGPFNSTIVFVYAKLICVIKCFNP